MAIDQFRARGRLRIIRWFGLWAGVMFVALTANAAPLTAAQAPTRTPLPSLTPSPTPDLRLPTGVPLPTATPSLRATDAIPALLPSPTSPLLAITPATNLTPLPTQPATEPGTAPPLTIMLPSGWLVSYLRVPIRVALEVTEMNVAIYRGPIQGGVGTILVLWGFPSIAPPPTLPPLPGTPTAVPIPGADFASTMLWSDGLRLLQGTVVDITCNVGTTGQLPFTVGSLPAVGTYFNVSQCQGEPDTAGWFAGVRQYNRNFLFYAFIEPIEAYNGARGELQRILDTVVFTPPKPVTSTATAP